VTRFARTISRHRRDPLPRVQGIVGPSDMDSYRASLGCATCARRVVTGFKGSDKVLLRKFEEAREEVVAYLEATGQRVKPVKLAKPVKPVRRKRVRVAAPPALARVAQ